MVKNRWNYKKIASGHYLAVNSCSICEREYNNGNVATSQYCPECSIIIKRKKTAERVKQYRSKHK